MQASNDIPYGGIFRISLVFSQTKRTGLVTNPHEIKSNKSPRNQKSITNPYKNKKNKNPSEKFELPPLVMV